MYNIGKLGKNPCNIGNEPSVSFIDSTFPTVRTVATEIQPPKSTEIKSIYVAFQMDTHFQLHKLTEIFSSIQSFDD